MPTYSTTNWKTSQSQKKLLHTLTHTHTYTHTLTHFLSHAHIHTHALQQPPLPNLAERLANVRHDELENFSHENNYCTHSHTHTLSHTYTHTHIHTNTLRQPPLPNLPERYAKVRHDELENFKVTKKITANAEVLPDEMSGPDESEDSDGGFYEFTDDARKPLNKKNRAQDAQVCRVGEGLLYSTCVVLCVYILTSYTHRRKRAAQTEEPSA